MNRIAGSEAEVAVFDLRRRYVPLLSTIAAIALSLLPIVTTTPLLPDFGFLFILTWRLLRPEIWTPRMALGLGLLSDLVGGHPIGQSMLMWTAAFLVLDLIDTRLGFRDYMMDWLIASGLVLVHTLGAWYIGLLLGADVAFGILWPQIVLSILFYPIAARIVLALDRWRLMR